MGYVPTDLPQWGFARQAVQRIDPPPRSAVPGTRPRPRAIVERDVLPSNPPAPLPDWADPKSEHYDPLRVLREKPQGNRPPPPPNPPFPRNQFFTLSTGPR